MGWTHEDIARHTPFLGELTKPVRGWKITAEGNVGAEIVIPVGAKLICKDRMGCLQLLAMYGQDRSVTELVMPNGQIVEMFYRLTDAAEAIPDEPKENRWCTPCQAYHASCPVNFGEGTDHV